MGSFRQNIFYNPLPNMVIYANKRENDDVDQIVLFLQKKRIRKGDNYKYNGQNIWRDGSIYENPRGVHGTHLGT